MPPAFINPMARCRTNLVPRARPRRGFTLVEVLATILLIGIVVPVAMTATGTAMKAADAARRRTEAAALAESKLAELIASGEWQTGASSGTFGDDHPGYQWSAASGNWTEATVQQLDVIVTWQADNLTQASLTVSTLVYLNNADAAATGGAGTGTGTGSAGG